jgi:RHS repeat-associated protein
LTTDHLGSTRVITSQTGGLVSRHDFLPFGEELATSNRTAAQGYGVADNVMQRYTGQQRDLEGPVLDYFGARYFQGAQGRFTSPDPRVHPSQSNIGPRAFISDPRRWNKYAYVSNNPLKYTDPNGAEQVVGCLGGSCANNLTGQSVPQQSLPEMVRTAAIPVAGAAAAAGGSALAWLGRAVVGYLMTPKGQETAAAVAEGLSGAPPGSLTGNLARLSASELSTGTRFAEQSGLQLTVSGHVGEEFVDAAGKTYDAMGQPAAFKFWNPSEFLDSITNHLNKSNDYTIIDLSGASSDQINTVKNFVGGLDQALQNKIKYVE